MARRGDDALVTDEMLGLAFVLGDGVLLAVLLWAFDVVSVVAVVTVAVLTVLSFAVWGATRWWRFPDGEAAEADPDPDPVATLRERYAAGDLSEAEFERKLERVLESSERAAGETGSNDGGAEPSPRGESPAERSR